MSRTVDQIRRIIIKSITAVAAIAFVLGALSTGAEGMQVVKAFAIMGISGAWLGLVMWANQEA